MSGDIVRVRHVRKVPWPKRFKMEEIGGEIEFTLQEGQDLGKEFRKRMETLDAEVEHASAVLKQRMAKEAK